MAIHGIGLGFRYALAEELFDADIPELTWLELHPENYVDRGGRFRYRLDQARERFPFATHGLTLGFGGITPPDTEYVRALRKFLSELGSPLHSEHLCFSGVDGVMLHDLLPLPFTEQAAELASLRFRDLRGQLECPLALENISYYAHPGPKPAMDEADFLNVVLDSTDGLLLLDVNNVCVNSHNHRFDPYAFVDRLPLHRVAQIHVAGPSERPNGLLIDTHGDAVREECYALLEYTLQRTGPVPVLLERDQNFPPLATLAEEVRRLHTIYYRATAQPNAVQPTTGATP